MLRGVGRGKHPSTVLRTQSRTPLLQIGDWNWRSSDGADITIQDLSIEGVTVGVLVVATSSVVLRRVDIRVPDSWECYCHSLITTALRPGPDPQDRLGWEQE